MYTEAEIDEIGLMLEEKGLSHSEIDDFFEHHGVKGQQWGVRRKEKRIARQIKRQQGSVDRFRRVARGGGSFRDKTAVALNAPLVDTIPKGLSGAARKHLGRARQNQIDIAHGKKHVLSFLLKMNGVHMSELNFKV